MSSSSVSPKKSVPSHKRKTTASNNPSSTPANTAEKKHRSLLFKTEVENYSHCETSLFRQAAAAGSSSAAAAAGEELFENTIQPPTDTRFVEDIGNSDNEDKPEGRNREHYQFKVKTNVKPQNVTITQNDGTKIKGDQLLLKVHQIIQKRIYDNQSTSYTREETENTDAPIKIVSGKQWLKSTGYWASTGANSEIKKNIIFKKIVVGPSSLKLKIEIQEKKYTVLSEKNELVKIKKKTERLFFDDPIILRKILDDGGAFKCLFEYNSNTQRKLIENREFCDLISALFPQRPSEFTINLLWDKNFKSQFFNNFNTKPDFKKKVLDIFLPYSDFSCKEIYFITNTLFSTSKYVNYYDDMLTAARQLIRLNGKTATYIRPDNYKEAWLDYVNAWMFGVESSRVNTTLVTGVMTLELIRGGKMGYHTAFRGDFGSENLDKVTIDGKDQRVGGEFPLATLHSGAGNLAARAEFMRSAEKRTIGTKSLRKYPQWHGVPLKEIITIINWLYFKKFIDPKLSSADQLIKIEKEVNKLIDDNFSA